MRERKSEPRGKGNVAQEFACGRGHVVMAWDAAKDPPDLDLTGYFCPACMGSIIGHGDIIDTRILAPVQTEESR